MSPIVTTSWLYANLDQPELIVLDASLSSTAEGKTAAIDPVTIPGARFFDLKMEFSDPDAPFPNTLPSPQQFENACRALGINTDSKIIIYDQMGIYSSPRAWWLFKAMGHEQVYVLDGGLPAWIDESYPIDNEHDTSYTTGNFKAKFQVSHVKHYEDVVRNVATKEFIIVDARSEGRFKGNLPEPRKQLKSGYIPGSVNIPYQQVLNLNKFKSEESLIQLFANKIGIDRPLAFSCGSGLTACIIMLANHLAGNETKVLYDGSWTEWATLQGLTVSGTSQQN